jgi:hypothetical protein
MGEVADLMRDGVLCETCGVLIGDGVGHPRICDECPEPMTPDRLRALRAQEARNGGDSDTGDTAEVP